MNVQKPDYFRASFATTESYDMASNALVEKSALVFIGLIQSEIGRGNGASESHRWQDTCNELATRDGESQVNDHGTSSAEDREDFVSTLR
jgi:hypothetical protein